MPNYANGAKKKKNVKSSGADEAAGKQKATPKGPVDPADMAALIAAKTARKNAAGAKVQKKTAAQKLAEYQASEAERRRKEKEAREKIAHRAAERAKQAELAAVKRRLEQDRTVESLTIDDDPQTIAQCVARTLGFVGASMKPKEILAKAVEKMPEVSLADGLPKEQLMILVGELVRRRDAKRANEAKKAAAAKAAAKAEQEKHRVAAQKRAETKSAEAAAAKQILDARIAEKKLAVQQRDSNLTEQQKHEAGATDNSDYTRSLTKEQIKAAKRAEAKAAAVVREAQQLESEIVGAVQASARARIAGSQQLSLGTIETGEFSLPNPGGGSDLLDEASLVLVPGRRYGLVGRNGKGKSTLLKYLSARRVGGGALPKSLSIHYVAQTSADDIGNEAEVAEAEQYKFLAVAGKDKYWREMSAEEQCAALHLGWTAESWDGGDAGPMEGLHWAGMTAGQVSAAEVLGHSAATWDLEMTPEAAAAAEAAAEAIRAEAVRQHAGPRPVEVVLRADMERSMLMEQVAGLETTDEDLSEEQHHMLEAAHERLREIGASSAVGRATTLLKNLGFSDELLSRSVRELSGGWRVRVALAAALFATPDVLLLDEPTNHLSIEAVIWLQHELSTNPHWESKIVMVVSHDRTFLDAVCTDTLHISGAARRLTQERGNYSAWAKRRVARKKAWDAKCNKREVEMAHMREIIARGGSYQNASIQRKMKQDQLSQVRYGQPTDLKQISSGMLTRNRYAVGT
eukprot:COSAG02_NODE_1144_length_14244_cov_16.832096_11_plen_744_part_00